MQFDFVLIFYISASRHDSDKYSKNGIVAGYLNTSYHSSSLLFYHFAIEVLIGK